jgi:hypothetical protein
MSTPTANTTATEHVTTSTDTPKLQTIVKPIMQQYVDDFYNFMRDELIKYVDMINDPEQENKHKSFMEYWCYCLYGDYGVKRKIHRYGDGFTEEELSQLTETQKQWYSTIYGPKMNSKLLLQFFYDKSIPSYSRSKSITRLCRHMVFDMATFSIVSLGVIKSLEEEDFYKNMKSVKGPGDTVRYQVAIEEFLEGTMVIYNPSMSNFNYNVVAKVDTEDTETQEDKDQKTSTKQKQPKNFTVSTRRKIGTSFFNKPGKTFYEMFTDNNTAAGIDFSSIDTEKISCLCLVFNVEHEDNRIIAPNPQNRNTLVAGYIMKPTEYNSHVMKDCVIPCFTLKESSTGTDTNTESQQHNTLVYEDKQAIESAFDKLAEHMVSESSVGYFVHKMKELFNFDITIPRTIATIQNTPEEISKYVNQNIAKSGEYSLGFMIRDWNSSMRYKIRKEKYKSLLELKGQYPISIHDKNQENLFKCYWKLRQKGQSSINTFIKLFDDSEGSYKKLFDEFKKEIHTLTHNLYLQYMSVFVDKEKHAREIPYLYAPLIGDLHTEYKKTKQPTTKSKVVKYFNALPVYKVFWRIFKPDIANAGKTDNSTTEQAQASNDKQQVQEEQGQEHQQEQQQERVVLQEVVENH